MDLTYSEYLEIVSIPKEPTTSYEKQLEWFNATSEFHRKRIDDVFMNFLKESESYTYFYSASDAKSICPLAWKKILHQEYSKLQRQRSIRALPSGVQLSFGGKPIRALTAQFELILEEPDGSASTILPKNEEFISVEMD